RDRNDDDDVVVPTTSGPLQDASYFPPRRGISLATGSLSNGAGDIASRQVFILRRQGRQSRAAREGRLRARQLRERPVQIQIHDAAGHFALLGGSAPEPP